MLCPLYHGALSKLCIGGFGGSDIRVGADSKEIYGRREDCTISTGVFRGCDALRLTCI